MEIHNKYYTYAACGNVEEVETQLHLFVGTHLSQYRIEDIKMRIEIDAIGRLQALGLVAFLLLHEYVQLLDDIGDTLCDFSAMG